MLRKIYVKFLTFIMLTFVVSVIASCGMPIQMPNKEARRVTAQLVDMAKADGSILESSEIKGYDLNLFPTIYRNAQELYVHPVDGQALVLAALAGVREEALKNGRLAAGTFDETASEALLASLDDYSTYFDEETYRSFQEQISGAYAGLGIEISKHDKGLLIISPFEDSPAARAGLKPGDIITHANSIDIGPMTVSDAIAFLRGRIGTSVDLIIARDGMASFDVTIRRDLISLQSVRWDIEGDVGYMRITNFTDNVGHKIQDAIKEIEANLGERLNGYVLDLRNNPGGQLREAIDVSGAFLDRKAVVSTRERVGEEVFNASIGDATNGKPIVVLINEGSASASEIVAGALQDHHRAVLMGATSYGKGSVQSVIPLYYLGGGIKLTTALYFTPSGRTVNGGIRPDRLIEDNPDKEGDEQLKAAYQMVVELAGGPNIMWGAGAGAQ